MCSVKLASINDLDQLVILFDGYRQFYQQPSDTEGARIFLQDRMQRSESVIFISFQDRIATGFTQLYPVFSSVSMRRTWLLNDLFVLPDARKSGAGSLLLDRAKEWGRETDAKWLLLSTACDNFTAQSLYEKNGWKKQSDIYYEFVL